MPLSTNHANAAASAPMVSGGNTFRKFTPSHDRILIIGGGVVGTALAREFANRGYGVTVLEKDHAGQSRSGQSFRNSCVVHSGVNQRPGTIKAALVVAGNKMIHEYCEAHCLPILNKRPNSGTLIVQLEGDDPGYLDTLMEYAGKNGLQGHKIVEMGKIADYEPHAKGVRALVSPTGAIIDACAFLDSLMREAMELGASFLMGERVKEIKKGAVITDKSDYCNYRVINAAGLYAADIAHMAGVGMEYEIIPFRGAYYEVKGAEVNSMIYHVPKIKLLPFLGIHMTRTSDGRVVAGPTAMLAFHKEQYDGIFSDLLRASHLKEAIGMLHSSNFWGIFNPFSSQGREMAKHVPKEVLQALSKTAFLNEMMRIYSNRGKPPIATDDLAPYRAGNRAQVVDKKGRLVEDILVLPGSDGSMHILNWVSPGFTTSLAGARMLVNELEGREKH